MGMSQNEASPFFFFLSNVLGVKKGAPHFETSPYTTEVFTGLGEGLRDWIRLDWIRLDRLDWLGLIWIGLDWVGLD